MNDDRPTDDDAMRDEPMLTAGELVLGLLEGAERMAALERLGGDPAFVAEVRRWEAALAPMFTGFAEREPSRDLYPDIRVRLDRVDGGEVTPLALARPAANENTPGSVPSAWRWGALASGGVAAVLAALLLTTPALRGPPAAPAPTIAQAPPAATRMMVAQLSGDEGEPRVVASAEAGNPMLRIRVLDMPGADIAPTGSVPVLWVIAGGGAPAALGALSGGTSSAGAGAVSQIAMRTALRKLIDDGATLAITYEPSGQAEYPAPTTPIVASGIISEL